MTLYPYVPETDKPDEKKLPVPDLTYKEHDEAMIIKGMKTVNRNFLHNLTTVAGDVKVSHTI